MASQNGGAGADHDAGPDGPEADAGGDGRRAYRVEVEGSLEADWVDWFDARRVEVHGGRTVIDLPLMEQAELHGVLRRLHDLHLRLLSVVALTSPG